MMSRETMLVDKDLTNERNICRWRECEGMIHAAMPWSSELGHSLKEELMV